MTLSVPVCDADADPAEASTLARTVGTASSPSTFLFTKHPPFFATRESTAAPPKSENSKQLIQREDPPGPYPPIRVVCVAIFLAPVIPQGEFLTESGPAGHGPFHAI